MYGQCPTDKLFRASTGEIHFLGPLGPSGGRAVCSGLGFAGFGFGFPGCSIEFEVCALATEGTYCLTSVVGVGGVPTAVFSSSPPCSANGGGRGAPRGRCVIVVQRGRPLAQVARSAPMLLRSFGGPALWPVGAGGASLRLLARQLASALKRTNASERNKKEKSA